MASSDRASDAAAGVATITVENVGGIGACEVAFEPGVSVLTGRNATNRTSLLSALGGVLGGSSASVKSDASEGRVRLELGGETYSRGYTRSGDGVQTGGSPFIDDVTLVDLFVTLLEDNPVRRAVERGDPLREVIMRPVDTGAIEARISELQAEKHSIEDEIETVSAARDDLPQLEDQRDSLEAAIEQIDNELAALRDEVAAAEADAETARAAGDVLETLSERRQERSQLEDQLEVKRAERDALRDDRQELKSALDDLVDQPGTDQQSIDEDLAAARARKRDLDETIASLTTIVEFNEALLSDEGELSGLDAGTSDVTAALAPEDHRDLVCWTCGTRVQRGAIRGRLDDLRAVIEEKREVRGEFETRIGGLEARREELQRNRSRRTELEGELDETRAKLSDVEEEIERLTARLAEVRSAVTDLEERAAKTEELGESDLPETYEQLADLQYERGQRAQQLEDIEASIQDVEALPDRATLEAQRDEIASELEQERSRIDDLETAAVEAFNEHMDELLGLLDYENVARVWLERKTKGPSAGPSVSDTSFALHVVRTSGDGAGYEDELSNLSESEREVIGLVVALAGYLVHQVYDQVPFMLLDSLEAIDSDRIAAVVSYFADYAPYLVVALLPEDASALDESHDRIPADVLAG